MSDTESQKHSVGWRPIETAPAGVPVLLARRGAIMTIATFESNWDEGMAWYDTSGQCIFAATHWRQLPDPPRREE